MRSFQRLTAGVALLCLSATFGCAEGGLLDNKTKQGAVVGTLAGAAAGAAIGGNKHRAGGADRQPPVRWRADSSATTSTARPRRSTRFPAPRSSAPQRRAGRELRGRNSVRHESSSLLPAATTGCARRADREQVPEGALDHQGHTDSQGDDRYNQNLSEERAETVRSYIVSEGVSSVPCHCGRLRLEDAGRDQRATAEGRQQNRRVEIEIRPDDEVMQSGDTPQ
jgi:outer membrane protein OmpA-like peptidoglycan-associated protein